MIDRSEERIKQTGEVFTPLELVDEILDKLPQELFKDPKKTFLDPACGDGNFLVRVVRRKIDNGSTIGRALDTTYGVELMHDNVKIARRRVLLYAWLPTDVKYLTHEEECKLINTPQWKQFHRRWYKITLHRILHRNSLEYDFTFDEEPLITVD